MGVITRRLRSIWSRLLSLRPRPPAVAPLTSLHDLDMRRRYTRDVAPRPSAELIKPRIEALRPIVGPRGRQTGWTVTLADVGPVDVLMSELLSIGASTFALSSSETS
jgi:hypothetical protein